MDVAAAFPSGSVLPTTPGTHLALFTLHFRLRPRRAAVVAAATLREVCAGRVPDHVLQRWTPQPDQPSAPQHAISSFVGGGNTYKLRFLKKFLDWSIRKKFVRFQGWGGWLCRAHRGAGAIPAASAVRPGLHSPRAGAPLPDSLLTLSSSSVCFC